MIPGFEENLVGKTLDSFSFNKLPEDYFKQDLVEEYHLYYSS